MPKTLFNLAGVGEGEGEEAGEDSSLASLHAAPGKLAMGSSFFYYLPNKSFISAPKIRTLPSLPRQPYGLLLVSSN